MNEIVKLFNYVQQQVVFVCLSNNIYSVTHHISFPVTEYGINTIPLLPSLPLLGRSLLAVPFKPYFFFNFMDIRKCYDWCNGSRTSIQPVDFSRRTNNLIYNVNLLFCFRYLPRLLQATCH